MGKRGGFSALGLRIRLLEQSRHLRIIRLHIGDVQRRWRLDANFSEIRFRAKTQNARHQSVLPQASQDSYSVVAAPTLFVGKKHNNVKTVDPVL